MKLDPHKVLQRFLRRVERRWNPPRRTLDTPPPLRKLPENVRAAAKTLVDPVAVKTVEHRNRVLKGQDYVGAHPLIVEFYKRLQKELERRNMPFYAFEFFRSNQRQRRLLKTGVTRAGPGQSPHNHGLAVDVVHSGRYWDLTREEWDVIGAIGKECARKLGFQVEWGGEWSFYDPAHWQLKDWRLWKLWREDRGYAVWPPAGGQSEREALLRDFRSWCKARGSTS